MRSISSYHLKDWDPLFLNLFFLKNFFLYSLLYENKGIWLTVLTKSSIYSSSTIISGCKDFSKNLFLFLISYKIESFFAELKIYFWENIEFSVFLVFFISKFIPDSISKFLDNAFKLMNVIIKAELNIHFCSHSKQILW